MPKLAGVSVLAILAAAVVMFLIGFVFYGLLFSDIYMSARAIEVAADAEPNPAYMAAGFVIELALAMGLGWLIQRLGAQSLGGAVTVGLTLAVLIGFPLMAYEFAYNDNHHSVPALLIDWAHIAATFTAGSAILYLLRGKPAAA